MGDAFWLPGLLGLLLGASCWRAWLRFKLGVKRMQHDADMARLETERLKIVAGALGDG